MKLLIVYAKDRNEVFNRKSAIGSYIHCLGSLLQEGGMDVQINGISINTGIESSPQNVTTSSFKNAIKKLIPKYIKRFIRDSNQLKKLEALGAELQESNEKYDAILEFYTLGSNIGLELSKKLNCPLFVTYDGPILEEYEFFNGSQPFFYDKVVQRQKETLSSAKKVVCYSSPMKNYIAEIVGSGDNIFLHQNVDFTRFDILRDDKTKGKHLNVCFIGSFLKWHQVEFLIQAYRDLKINTRDIQLYLIGDGMEKDKMEQLANRLGLLDDDGLYFTGFLDGKELFELKKKMHIGVMPGSNWYGAPNKIFEYGAMKLAVLAPNTPTIDDLFSEGEIKFFEWQDYDSFKTELSKLIESSSMIQSLSDELHQKILKKYTPQSTKLFYSDLMSI